MMKRAQGRNKFVLILLIFIDLEKFHHLSSVIEIFLIIILIFYKFIKKSPSVMTKRAQGRNKFGLKNFKSRFFRLNTRCLAYAKNKVFTA